MLPITFSCGGSFPVGHALIDTGADITLLPMEMRKWIGVDLDERVAIQIGSAGGGGFTAIPSAKKVVYAIEKPGYRTLRWKGTVFFAPRQPIVLLGHYQCLEYLHLTFNGKHRKLGVALA
jgi:predicted aspartyl protease